MQRTLIVIIRLYAYLLSPLTGPCCRFYPCCSNYAEQAIRKYGVLKGTAMAMARVCKCHPYHPGGYDPVL